jgi:hypothetical protein
VGSGRGVWWDVGCALGHSGHEGMMAPNRHLERVAEKWGGTAQVPGRGRAGVGNAKGTTLNRKRTGINLTSH